MENEHFLKSENNIYEKTEALSFVHGKKQKALETPLQNLELIFKK